MVVVFKFFIPTTAKVPLRQDIGFTSHLISKLNSQPWCTKLYSGATEDSQIKCNANLLDEGQLKHRQKQQKHVDSEFKLYANLLALHLPCVFAYNFDLNHL